MREKFNLTDPFHFEPHLVLKQALIEVWLARGPFTQPSLILCHASMSPLSSSCSFPVTSK